jgi:hypothetical protein
VIVWISSPLGILAWFPCLDAEEGTFLAASRLSRLAVAQEAGVQAAQPVNVKEVVYSHPGFRPSPGGHPGIAVARAFDYLTEVHGDSASRANFAQYGGGSLESRGVCLACAPRQSCSRPAGGRSAPNGSGWQRLWRW